MAGLALFSLKDPSLLAFCGRALDHNLRSVFGLQAIPSDTQMREILDEVDPQAVRPFFKDVFRQLQRGKVLEDYVFLDGCYLVALDGVEYFRSKKVHCDHCMNCQHKNGESLLLPPDARGGPGPPGLLRGHPLGPRADPTPDGSSKNDCERNAARRWLKQFRKDHPHLPVIVTEDALSSNAPHIRDLLDDHVHFILGVKEADHKHLFEQFQERLEADEVGRRGGRRRQRGSVAAGCSSTSVSINESNQDVIVNLLVYVEIDADGQIHKWAWVTDLMLTARNVQQVALAGGRAGGSRTRRSTR